MAVYRSDFVGSRTFLRRREPTRILTLFQGGSFTELTPGSILSHDGIFMSDEPTASHSVARRRTVLGWSQTELSRRAGIPRTTVSAIEGQRLTPSVRTALSIAQALDSSVEELFGNPEVGPVASRPEWAWAPRFEPSRYWEADVSGRRWRYPAESLATNRLRHDGVWRGGPDAEAAATLASSTLVMASCDPAAAVMAQEYARTNPFRLLVFPRGGRQALDLLKQGLVHVAGVHQSTPDHPHRNAELARSIIRNDVRGIRAAEWSEGLALSSDNPVRSPKAALRTIKRWALREAGSAARACLDELSDGLSLRGRTVSNHAAVAEAVRSGWADGGVCVKLCAQEAGLNFLPVRTELLDLFFFPEIERDPRLLALVRLLRSDSYRRWIGELPGYETRYSGEWISN